jgi:DNA-directed RNA polymerase subunit RPC12/RpoP
MAKSIKCNQCGSSDLIKLDANEYQCRYCNSRIVLEKPKPDLGSFIKTLNPTHVVGTSQTAYTPDGQVVKAFSKMGCFIAIIIFGGVLTGIITPIVVAFSGRHHTSATASKTGSADWNLSYTQQVFYANGSKGGVIWQIDEENYNYEKSRNVLSILDAKTKKVLYFEIIVNEHKSGEDVPSVWDLFGGGRVFGDMIFITPKNGGLIARNIYSGQVVRDNAHFEKLVGDQIAEARAYSTSYADDHLDLKDAQGTAYYYYPLQDSVQKRDLVTSAKNKKDKEVYYFMFCGETDKKYVLRVRQQVKAGERSGFFHASTLTDYKNDKNYYKQYYKILSVDSVPATKGFFDPNFITWDDTSFVVDFKENLLDNAKRVVARYGLSGKQLWKIVPIEQKPFTELEKKEDKPRFDLYYINNSLIVSLNSPKKIAIAIEPASGKIAWTYKAEK